MSTPNSHYGQIAAVLLSRTYVFAAFGGRWPGVAFLNLALNRNLTLSVPRPLRSRTFKDLHHWHQKLHSDHGCEALLIVATVTNVGNQK
jgi:hypothetical protein